MGHTERDEDKIREKQSQTKKEGTRVYWEKIGNERKVKRGGVSSSETKLLSLKALVKSEIASKGDALSEFILQIKDFVRKLMLNN